MRRKTAGIIAAGLAAMVALTGCNRSDTSVFIGDDGRIGSVVTQVGVQKDALGELGINELSEFVYYIENDRGTPNASEICDYSENPKEYVVTCETVDATQFEDPLDDIVTSVSGSTIILSAREGSIVSDLEDPALSGIASGTIVFYFDGAKIVEVDNPANNHRITNDNVVTFSLENGKFFQNDVTVVAERGSNAFWWFIGIGLALCLLLGVVLYFLARKEQGNPFLTEEESIQPRVTGNANE